MIFKHKGIMLEQALQNVIISYDKIKYNIFEILAIPKGFSKIVTNLLLTWLKIKLYIYFVQENINLNHATFNRRKNVSNSTSTMA